MPEDPSESVRWGLDALRRSGRVTELLFLYEVATGTHSRLRSIAKALGISVQATSLLYRELAQREWITQSDGVYRPTIQGTEALHAGLSTLTGDLEDRLARLRIIRKCRAIAAADLEKGDRVRLELREGTLTATRGEGGPSQGRVARGGRKGDLVEVVDLQGIVPITSAKILIIVISSPSLNPDRDVPLLRRALSREPLGLLAADGLEAWYLASRATRGPILRFGVAMAAREASQVGVPVTVLTTDDLLPSLLQRLTERSPQPPLEIKTLT